MLRTQCLSACQAAPPPVGVDVRGFAPNTPLVPAVLPCGFPRVQCAWAGRLYGASCPDRLMARPAPYPASLPSRSANQMDDSTVELGGRYPGIGTWHRFSGAWYRNVGTKKGGLPPPITHVRAKCGPPVEVAEWRVSDWVKRAGRAFEVRRDKDVASSRPTKETRSEGTRRATRESTFGPFWCLKRVTPPVGDPLPAGRKASGTEYLGTRHLKNGARYLDKKRCQVPG